jgi:4-amino-4-deoxy-L-arabinose transferase-like glycosyltransferase
MKPPCAKEERVDRPSLGSLAARTPYPLLAALVLAAFYAIQSLYIYADSPASLSQDIGIFIDEGFKTLDAKNRILYGKPHWSELDDYPGWGRSSPITVASNFLMFQLFGVSLAAARHCSLLYAMGTLFVLYLFLSSAYDRKTALVCLILLASNHIFFFHSRLALFEDKMLFFMVGAVYFMKRSKENPLFTPVVALFCSASYYCKPTAAVFIISLCIYYSLTAGHGFLIRNLLRPKGLALLVLGGLILVGATEAYLSSHPETAIWGRGFRRPIQALLTLPTPILFKKIPLLGSFAFLYIGYLVALIADRQPYRNADVLFAVWLLGGLVAHSLFEYRPLRYYWPYLVPLAVLSARSLFCLSEILRVLFNGQNRLIKASVFVISCLFLTVFSAWFLLSHLGWLGSLRDVARAHTALLAFAGILTVSTLFLFLNRFRKAVRHAPPFLTRIVAILCFLLILLAHTQPIYRWARHPRYELAAIFEKVRDLGPGAVMVGQWAPQICIETRARALYSDYFGVGRGGKKKYYNVLNLRELGPGFMSFVPGVNDEYAREVRTLYPGVVAETPLFEMKYAGKTVQIYRMSFGDAPSSPL